MNIGDSAFSDGDVMRRLHELEGLVRELVAGRRLENATVGAGGMRVRGTGGITLQEGGDLAVEDGGDIRLVGSGDLEKIAADGTQIFYVGIASDGNDMFRLARDDGTTIMVTGTFADGPQYWSLQDRFGHDVVSDDAETGWGVANPRLAPALYPHYATLPDSIGSTTSPTYVPLWEGEFRVANPWLQLGVLLTWTSSETSGELRVRINGATAYESGVVTNQTLNTGRLDATAGQTLSPGEQVHVFVDARVSSGSGNLICAPIGMYAR